MSRELLVALTGLVAQENGVNIPTYVWIIFVAWSVAKAIILTVAAVQKNK